jgi:hypothetical protein
LIEAGNDLDQGRLAGAVLAHERVNLAGLEGERDAVECLHAWKCLADTFDLEPHFNPLLRLPPASG